MRQTLQKRRGQGMTEYIIIVALIALAAIGAVSTFGNDLRRLFGMMTNSLSGATNVASTVSVYVESKNATLSNFGNTGDEK